MQLKKIVLEKNHVIKLYKVIEIKRCGEIIIHLHTLHHE